MGYEWLALCAAFLWAVSSLISVIPAQHLGAFSYSRWRMGCRKGKAVRFGILHITWATGLGAAYGFGFASRCVLDLGSSQKFSRPVTEGFQTLCFIPAEHARGQICLM